MFADMILGPAYESELEDLQNNCSDMGRDELNVVLNAVANAMLEAGIKAAQDAGIPATIDKEEGGYRLNDVGANVMSVVNLYETMRGFGLIGG